MILDACRSHRQCMSLKASRSDLLIVRWGIQHVVSATDWRLSSHAVVWTTASVSGVTNGVSVDSCFTPRVDRPQGSLLDTNVYIGNTVRSMPRLLMDVICRYAYPREIDVDSDSIV